MATGRVRIKRVYDPPAPQDGLRVLVDRLWPRGLTREALHIDRWLKDVAPSDALRRWFGHDPAKWKGFLRRYWAELEANPDVWRPLVTAARQGQVTLLYGARDATHNNAVALLDFLPAKLRPAGRVAARVGSPARRTRRRGKMRSRQA